MTSAYAPAVAPYVPATGFTTANLPGFLRPAGQPAVAAAPLTVPGALSPDAAAQLQALQAQLAGLAQQLDALMRQATV